MGSPAHKFQQKLNRRIAGRRKKRSHIIAVGYDGERTEDRYFRGWRMKLGSLGNEIRPYYLRSGGNVLHAVEYCCAWAKSEGPFDEVYCVCDVDDTSASDLVKAKALALKNGINLCVSARSFEVWLALHWGKISLAPIDSEKSAIGLVAKFESNYCKKCKEVEFGVLFPLTKEACNNAKWLEQQNITNPATDVHKLVGKLLNICSK